jgi:hypothetical protein
MQRHDRVGDRCDVIGSCRRDQTMAVRQPGASLADRDASRSHGPMMTERDESPTRTRPNVAVKVMSSGPIVDLGMAAFSLVQSYGTWPVRGRCTIETGDVPKESSDRLGTVA